MGVLPIQRKDIDMDREGKHRIEWCIEILRDDIDCSCEHCDNEDEQICDSCKYLIAHDVAIKALKYMGGIENGED